WRPMRSPAALGGGGATAATAAPAHAGNRPGSGWDSPKAVPAGFGPRAIHSRKPCGPSSKRRTPGAAHCASDNTTEEDVMRKLIISLAASAVITAGAVAGLQASSQASTDGNRLQATFTASPVSVTP